jgi:hypothetical protein
MTVNQCTVYLGQDLFEECPRCPQEALGATRAQDLGNDMAMPAMQLLSVALESSSMTHPPRRLDHGT